jgi:uncharacterized protein YjbI with pentapeptide repeats
MVESKTYKDYIIGQSFNSKDFENVFLEGKYYINCRFSNIRVIAAGCCLINCKFTSCTIVCTDNNKSDFINCNFWRGCIEEDNCEANYTRMTNCEFDRVKIDGLFKITNVTTNNIFELFVNHNEEDDRYTRINFVDNKLINNTFYDSSKIRILKLTNSDAIHCTFVNMIIICTGEVDLFDCIFDRCTIIDNNDDFDVGKYVNMVDCKLIDSKYSNVKIDRCVESTNK